MPFAAPAAAPSCTPKTVTVALLGDSTQFGIDGATTRPGYFGDQAPHNPGAQLQADMDARFGAGAVVVTNYGVPGSVAPDGRSVVADVIVENFGANDLVGRESQDAFRAAILALHPTLVETQMPTPYDDPAEASYVATVKGMGLPVVDANAYVRSLPNWRSYFPDQESVHGTDELYRLITDNVLAPAVAAQVAPLRCNE